MPSMPSTRSIGARPPYLPMASGRSILSILLILSFPAVLPILSMQRRAGKPGNGDDAENELSTTDDVERGDNMRQLAASTLTVLMLVIAAAMAEETKEAMEPVQIEGATVEVYKIVDDAQLNMYILTPEGHKASDKRPAIVFFFGGGKGGGETYAKTIRQMDEFLASLGYLEGEPTIDVPDEPEKE